MHAKITERRRKLTPAQREERRRERLVRDQAEVSSREFTELKVIRIASPCALGRAKH